MFGYSHEWWHSVCINRASSCCRQKNQHWNAFLLTIDLPAGWLMSRINAPCCVCTPACACMFACLCVCRWSTKSWGGQRGGGAPIVNTPRGEPIKHWLRRGSKSRSQPAEIKRARWSLQITAGKYTPLYMWAYVSVCACVSTPCPIVNHSCSMQTPPATAVPWAG